MAQIGRRIYYELSTGNVILNIGLRSGDVVDTTETQDFADYTALQPYQQSAVGVMNIPYGQDETNFQTYPFHIDITQSPPVIAWDTSAPYGASLQEVQQAKLAQLSSMRDQALQAGFTSSADGTSRTYPTTPAVQQAIQEQTERMLTNLATWPQQWQDALGNLTSFTQAQFTQFLTDYQNFKAPIWEHFQTLANQVSTATTTTAVNAIQW